MPEDTHDDAIVEDPKICSMTRTFLEPRIRRTRLSVHKQRVCPHISIRWAVQHTLAGADWNKGQPAGRAAIRGATPK